MGVVNYGSQDFKYDVNMRWHSPQGGSLQGATPVSLKEQLVRRGCVEELREQPLPFSLQGFYTCIFRYLFR